MLVRVRAAALNALDAHLLRGKPLPARLGLGLLRPRRGCPGVDVAGIVEAVGSGTRDFAPGDAVFGTCRGALAQYAVAGEGELVAKPLSATFEEAAALPIAGVTALQGLRDKGGLRPGQRVLINGAGGGVGTFAVQIAATIGAETTGVCSAAAAPLVRRLGANRVVDYARQDFTRGDQCYDLVFDLVSNHSFAALARVLKPGGRVVVAGLGGSDRAHFGRWLRLLAGGMIGSRFGSRGFHVAMARKSRSDLATLAELVETGKVKPAIDRVYPLDEAVEAMRHLFTGRAHGKIVVAV